MQGPMAGWAGKETATSTKELLNVPLAARNRLFPAAGVASASTCRRATSRTSQYDPTGAIASSGFLAPVINA